MIEVYFAKDFLISWKWVVERNLVFTFRHNHNRVAKQWYIFEATVSEVYDIACFRVSVNLISSLVHTCLSKPRLDVALLIVNLDHSIYFYSCLCCVTIHVWSYKLQHLSTSSSVCLSFSILGCQSDNLFVHMISFFLATCSAHLHFEFWIPAAVRCLTFAVYLLFCGSLFNF